MLLRLWFLVLCVLASAFASPRADARAAANHARQNEVAGQKLAPGFFESEAAILRQAAAMQAAELQQAKSGRGYDFASGCLLAAERGAGWFDDVARNATRNAGSDKLVLGHFSRTGVSYQKVAAHHKATYFKVDNWNAVTKGLSQDEIWRINETFLTQQLRQGKQILFSHDPLKARAGSFFEREVSFLKDLGYNIKQKNPWTWEAVK